MRVNYALNFNEDEGIPVKKRRGKVAKITPKERKQKKEIAKKIMEFNGINYNEWLHEKHTEYIDEHLIDYMKAQEEPTEEKDEDKEIQTSESKRNIDK